MLPFFLRLEEAEHKKGFTDAVKDFVKRIQERVRVCLSVSVAVVVFWLVDACGCAFFI